MRTLAIDCRMAQKSGIGVYVRSLVPLCMSAMPDVRFRLLGYDGSFAVPADREWEAVPCNAPVYGVAEQYAVASRLGGCNALWSPHYPVPVFAAVPLVVTVHDMAHLALRDLYRGAKRLYARIMFQAVRYKAAEILFISEFTRQEFLYHAGKPRGVMTVAHNGIDARWLEIPLEDRAVPPYFLAVGNVKPHKNVQFLCRAFAAIAGSCDANFLFIGENSGFRVGEMPVEKLMDICPGRIFFTGFVSREELVRLMGKAAALVFPSRYEGFGLPLLEALAAGVPVIASDLRVSREVCGDFAGYFPLGSAGKLGEKLLETLAMSPDERRRQGEAGRAWARRFTWEKTAELTVPALRRALAGQGVSP